MAVRKIETQPQAPSFTEAEIGKRLSALVTGMMAKGKVQPEAYVMMCADEQTSVSVSWKDTNKPAHTYDRTSQRFSEGALDKRLKDAEAFVAALPGKKAEQFDQFMKAVAQAIDIGRENGIDVEFTNPLAETMKRLSENALTFQAVA